MSESLYERVKKRAYEIWEEEGQPWGRDAIHWERAHREIAAAPIASAASIPQAAEAAPQPKAKEKTVKAPARRAPKKTAG